MQTEIKQGACCTIKKFLLIVRIFRLTLEFKQLLKLTLQNRDLLQYYQLPCHGSTSCPHCWFLTESHFPQLPKPHPVQSNHSAFEN